LKRSETDIRSGREYFPRRFRSSRVLYDRINTHDLSRPTDASAPEEVHFPPGLVAGHASDNRRHRPAAGVPGQPSDLAQHEPHTEKLPQGVERCVGSDSLRAGPPDGRRQW